ncbi:unnamed protein product [Phytomonas sp. Hart1]|nr:unnamed protein product [Phytomonas sp. Hart1]|eukprot:CCW69451.1 unnamed protein product [Phytomonas sp. isolate Hart1]
MFFAGKALVQRAAIVTIQSIIRGFLARRRYTSLRVKCDGEFRKEYVLERLARLSRAWERTVDQQERLRKSFLACLDVQKQAIAGAYLTESDWRALIQRHLLNPDPASLVDHPTISNSGNQKEKMTGRSALTQCPICLEHIKMSSTVLDGRVFAKGPTAASEGDFEVEGSFCFQSLTRPTVVTTTSESKSLKKGEKVVLDHELHSSCDIGKDDNLLIDSAESEGERYVRELRRAYEQKRDAAQRQQGTTLNKNIVYKNPSAKVGKEKKSRRLPGTRKNGEKEKMRQISKKGNTVGVEASPNDPSSTSLPSYGSSTVILSCSHIFHHACLTAFEQYQRWYATNEIRSENTSGNVADVKVVMPPRCPLCRAGYAKCHF